MSNSFNDDFGNNIITHSSSMNEDEENMPFKMKKTGLIILHFVFFSVQAAS